MLTFKELCLRKDRSNEDGTKFFQSNKTCEKSKDIAIFVIPTKFMINLTSRMKIVLCLTIPIKLVNI